MDISKEDVIYVLNNYSNYESIGELEICNVELTEEVINVIFTVAMDLCPKLTHLILNDVGITYNN
jgi:hypothetical protein